MPYFEWKENYSVGVKEMDKQHKILIDIINKLYEAMKIGKGSTEIGPIIDEMVNYTKYHFESEEKLMTTHGYPGLLHQKGEHKAFTSRAIDYQTQVRSGKVSMTIEVMNFLKDWLLNHILVNDMKYSKFFADKGVG